MARRGGQGKLPPASREIRDAGRCHARLAFWQAQDKLPGVARAGKAEGRGGVVTSLVRISGCYSLHATSRRFAQPGGTTFGRMKLTDGPDGRVAPSRAARCGEEHLCGEKDRIAVQKRSVS